MKPFPSVFRTNFQSPNRKIFGRFYSGVKQSEFFAAIYRKKYSVSLSGRTTPRGKLMKYVHSFSGARTKYKRDVTQRASSRHVVTFL